MAKKITKKIFCFVLIGAILASGVLLSHDVLLPIAYAQLKQTNKAKQTNKTEQASNEILKAEQVAALKREAEAGDTKVQNELGTLYYDGHFRTDKMVYSGCQGDYAYDYASAVKWLTLAAENGD